jgi:hypothetical protein
MMNLLLRPTLQLKLPAVVLIVTLGFVALQVAHTQLAYGKLFDVVFEEAGRPPFLKDLLREQTHDYLEVTTVLTLVYIFVVVIVSVAYGHRMIGPMVPLRRQTEALKNGDYGARVTLRKRNWRASSRRTRRRRPSPHRTRAKPESTHRLGGALPRPSAQASEKRASRQAMAALSPSFLAISENILLSGVSMHSICTSMSSAMRSA